MFQREKKAKAKPAKKETKQAKLDFEGEFELPSVDLLARPAANAAVQRINEESLEKNARLLETVLDDFGVKGQITRIRPGPVVTLYELEPAPGTKTSRVVSLADDVARSMSAVSVRIAVVPGRSVIGIELPNRERETVALRELLEDEGYNSSQAKLALVLGKDIGGQPIVVDLARMPHLLIAGTTGSGKSVAINTMIMSLLYRLTPDQCKFIMIDPKMLELSVYDDIPHLLAPVVTEPKKAIVALKWVVREMENRYRAMSKLGVRNIEGYNQRLEQARNAGEQLTRRVQTGFDPDTGKPIYEEEPFDLNRPALHRGGGRRDGRPHAGGGQGHRGRDPAPGADGARGRHPHHHGDAAAVGRRHHRHHQGQLPDPHLLPRHHARSTAAPSWARPGAEQLLGQGDMLYMANGGRITRIHGPFISDREVESIVKCLKSQGEPAYLQEVTESDEDGAPRRGCRRLRRRQRRLGRRPLRPGGRAGGARAQMLDQLHPALPADRLQPRRPHRRAHGKGRRGQPGQPRRQARSAGAGRAGAETSDRFALAMRLRRETLMRANDDDRRRHARHAPAPTPVGSPMAEILTVAGLLLGGLIASEIGYRLGVAFSPKYEAFGRQFDVIRGATFALVAFLIAFSFSGAGSALRRSGRHHRQRGECAGHRLAARRRAAGAAAGRAQGRLKEYTDDRVVILSSRDRDEIVRLLAKVGGLHGKNVGAGAGRHRRATRPLMTLVLPPINDVIDLHTTHLALATRRLPLPILIVLLATSALSLVLVGFGNGRSRAALSAARRASMPPSSPSRCG